MFINKDEDTLLIEKNGFDDAIIKYKKIIKGIIFNIVKDRELTNDLSQDVMIKLLENKHKYNKKYPLNVWIYSLTRNYVFDYLDKKSTKNRIKTLGQDYLVDKVDNVVMFGDDENVLYKNLIKKLTPLEKQILDFKMNDMHNVDILNELGLKKSELDEKLNRLKTLLVKTI